MVGDVGPYGYSGDMTSPAWTTQIIAGADTNFNFVNGALVPADPGAIGKYIVVRLFNVSPGDHKLVVGKILPSGIDWTPFWGPYVTSTNQLGITVANDGSVVPFVPVVLPGSYGDQGRNAIIRTTYNDSTSITLFFNDSSAFAGLTAPFIRVEDSVGVYKDTIMQTAVPGYPNWGQVTIPYSSFLVPGELEFQYGYNGVLAKGMMKNSATYYQGSYQNLKITSGSFSVMSARIKKK
jgi:hypothetical protein